MKKFQWIVLLPILVTLSLVSYASVTIERIIDKPIIDANTHPSIGQNIQGPSLIKVPAWIKKPLGRYYLYFADHKGKYIRLAYADDLTGPWKIHVPGSLQLTDTPFAHERPTATAKQVEQVKAFYKAGGTNLDHLGHDPVKELTEPHIASPDVHVDEKNKRIVMYYHGLKGFATQRTAVAVSEDGIHFQASPAILGKTYWRMFSHKNSFYALAMPGQLYRSDKWLGGFEKGPLLFNRDMRHAGLMKQGNKLNVFWTQVGEAPEKIMLSTIDISNPWTQWKESGAIEVLRPEKSWEGADAPLIPSVRSSAYGIVNQLRDPAIYIEGDSIYLLYAIAGESGIGIVKVHLDDK